MITILYMTTTGDSILVYTSDGATHQRSDLSSEQITELRIMFSMGKHQEILDAIVPDLTIKNALEQVLDDRFYTSNGSLYMKGIPISIPKLLSNRIVKQGKADEALVNFWQLCALNPDVDARDNLFWFLDRYDFKITKHGYFIAYRNVRTTTVNGVYTDDYTRRMKIRIGEPVRIDRSKCDPRQDHTCSSGLHCAGAEWLGSYAFGNVTIAVLVNPMHVVAVPPDDGYGKMRVCEYYPLGLIQRDEDNNVIPYTEEEASQVDYLGYSFDDINDQLLVAKIEDGNQKVLFDDETDTLDALELARKSIQNRLHINDDDDYEDEEDYDDDEPYSEDAWM